MGTELLLFPFGGNAREALCCLPRGGALRPVGFVDDNPGTHEATCCGVPVLGGREWLGRMPSAQVLAVPGSPATYARRQTVLEGLALPPARYATVVHSHASVAGDVALGVNVLIMPGAFVGAGARVGSHVLIMAGAVVSHDAVIADYAIIAAGAMVAGGAVVERGAYVGAGARLREGARIGAGALVGMGAVVLDAVPPGEVWAGVPARPVHGGAS